MKKNHLVFIAGILGLMCSCSYNEYVPEEVPPIDTSKIYSFAIDIQPIFDGKCTSCHGSSGGLNLESGNSYSNIVPTRINETTPEESVIYTKASPSGSHMAKYSGEEAQSVLQWITQGAKDN